jgi:hypothetical protein
MIAASHRMIGKPPGSNGFEFRRGANNVINLAGGRNQGKAGKGELGFTLRSSYLANYGNCPTMPGEYRPRQ